MGRENQYIQLVNVLVLVQCSYALNLDILQLASSDLHKRYMARKASLIVILAYFAKQIGCHITFLMSFGNIPLKRPYISLTIAPRGSGCENNL